MRDELWGVRIRGDVWRNDDTPLDADEFLDKFIAFVESNGWYFGGVTRNVDLEVEEE